MQEVLLCQSAAGPCRLPIIKKGEKMFINPAIGNNDKKKEEPDAKVKVEVAPEKKADTNPDFEDALVSELQEKVPPKYSSLFAAAIGGAVLTASALLEGSSLIGLTGFFTGALIIYLSQYA